MIDQRLAEFGNAALVGIEGLPFLERLAAASQMKRGGRGDRPADPEADDVGNREPHLPDVDDLGNPSWAISGRWFTGRFGTMGDRLPLRGEGAAFEHR